MMKRKKTSSASWYWPVKADSGKGTDSAFWPCSHRSHRRAQGLGLHPVPGRNLSRTSSYCSALELHSPEEGKTSGKTNLKDGRCSLESLRFPGSVWVDQQGKVRQATLGMELLPWKLKESWEWTTNLLNFTKAHQVPAPWLTCTAEPCLCDVHFHGRLLSAFCISVWTWDLRAGEVPPSAKCLLSKHACTPPASTCSAMRYNAHLQLQHLEAETWVQSPESQEAHDYNSGARVSSALFLPSGAHTWHSGIHARQNTHIQKITK